MRFLLDTNVLVFLLSAPSELSEKASRVIRFEPDLYASMASLWEIGIKQGLGKLRLGLTIPEIEEQCIERDIRVLPIRSTAIERLKRLPDIHRDPFDRLLVAHAQEEEMAIVTRDKTIPLYPVQTIW